MPNKNQRVEPCGCVVTENVGHTHTKMCEEHLREDLREMVSAADDSLRTATTANNLDLIGG